MKIAISLFVGTGLLLAPLGPGWSLEGQELPHPVREPASWYGERPAGAGGSLPAVESLSLSLEEAVARALEANPTLRAQRARAEARGQLPLQASRAFLPSLNLGLQGMKTTDPVAVFGLKLRQEEFQGEDLALDALNRPDAYSGYNASATIQMPLLAPEGLFGFAAARKAAEAEKAGARRAAGATRFYTIQAYTGAVLAARQVAALGLLHALAIQIGAAI